MYVRTEPREIAARWIKPGDEVAVYEVEDGSGEADSGRRGFARTEEFVTRSASVDWMLVVDGSRLVRPPADEAARRPEGTVKHSAGGYWSVEPMARDFVPDEVDHIGAHKLVLVPISRKGSHLGPPVRVYADEAEQFVIRERVKVEARNMDSDNGRVSSRLRTLAERAEDQRPGVRVTASESVIAILRADTSGESAIGDAAALAAIGVEPDIDGPREAPRDAWLAGYREGGRNAREAEQRRGPGETTRRLPMRRIPMGVMGQSLGRQVAESAAINFASERDSSLSEG